MSNLHVYFALRNQQSFSKALDGSRSNSNTTHAQPVLSSSAGRSWTRTIALSSGPLLDVNARDWLGRTVLHLACTVVDPYALAYVQLLLAHPQINVNIQDLESRWTPLHRALYVGNIAASILLLKRFDIDIHLRDNEGLTAFDLYNSTIDDTSPSVDRGSDPLAIEGVGADLFTWGANRNATLGHGDSDDRTFPDQVVLHRHNNIDVSTIERFTTTQVKCIHMAKLHTVVITDEKRGNLRACGFGSGGRLGPNHHTQYSLLPVPQFTHRVIAIALGQDHTLALTFTGEVLSWGLNRFSQLGYVVEPVNLANPLHIRAMEEPIQAIARRVLGPLRRENVLGVAACKTASACWTEGDVFTWGTNSGQLGYNCTAQPVQILPRVVTGVQNAIALSLTDTVMACLLENKDVVCFRDDGRFRVKFPLPEISDLPAAYLPPFVVKPPIAKITSCDGVFAALSERGDVFTFAVPTSEAGGGHSYSHMGSSAGYDGGLDRAEKFTVKPQRVWSARKSFDPAVDVALGSDGEMILCTESGHVYVRSRSANKSNSSASVSAITNKSSNSPSITKASKFHRVPYIHRAVKVSANSTGAFAALRLNYIPRMIPVEGMSMVEDMKGVRPWVKFDDLSVRYGHGDGDKLLQGISASLEDHEEEATLGGDVADTIQLCAMLVAEKRCEKVESRGLFQGEAHKRLAHGADIFIQAGMDIPAHRVLLAARSSTIRGLIESEHGGSVQGQAPLDTSITIKYRDHGKGKGKGKGTTTSRLTVTGCHTMSVLLILEYIYSDDIPAIWDRRVGIPCAEQFRKLKISPTQVKAEVECLARILDLPFLSAALSTGVKHVPERSFSVHMERLFDVNNSAPSVAASPTTTFSPSNSHPCSVALKPDVCLELRDRTVACHSVLLRARCPFFRSFFDDEDWTTKRWTKEGTITVDMKHMEWKASGFVLRWIYTGKDEGIFDHATVDSINDLLDLIFGVMAIASELLLDKLMLICSSTLLRYVTLTNITSLLADATYYNALSLVTTLQDYIACNLEAIMESNLLDTSTFSHNSDVTSPDSDLIKSLSTFIRHKQADKLPFVRSNLLVDMAMCKEANVKWLEEQDIPGPIVRSHPRDRVGRAGEKPVLPRHGSANVEPGSGGATPLGSPILGALGSGTKTSPPRTPSSMNTKSIPAHEGDDIFSMEVEAIPSLNISNDHPRTNPSPRAINVASTSSTSCVAPVVRPAWKASSSSTKLDMKTIMAETAKDVTASTPLRTLATDPNPATSASSSRTPSKPSQRERRRGDTDITQVSPVSTQRTLASPGTPWRLPVAHTSTAANPISVSMEMKTSIHAAHPGPSTSYPSPLAPKTSRLQPTSVVQTQTSSPLLGPVYTPALAGKRTHSESPAWSNVPVIHNDPVSLTGVSFAAIQQQQQSQGKGPKGKQSLREIQEEERAKQEEEDFLKWWAAEEERLKVEAMAADNHGISNQGDRPSQHRQERGHSRRKVTRGKGSGSRRGVSVENKQ